MSNSITMLMLDLPTVLFLYSTSLIAGTCAVLNAWRHQRNETGLGRIALALAVLAVGGGLAGLSELALLPWPFLWRYVHFLLGVGGYAALWSGLAELSSPRWCAWRLRVALVPLLWLLVGMLTGFVAHNEQRAAVFHFNAFFFLLAAAFCMWHDRHAEPLASRLLLSLTLLLSALLYGSECYWIVSSAWSRQLLSWAFFAQIICNFTLVLLVLTFLSERAAIRLRQASERDELTGVGNRRYLFARLPAQAEAGNAIIMADVDHFKRVNDCFGHLGGDRVLAVAAQALQATLREQDLIARFGGEEFVIFLAQVSQAEARSLAERLRLQLAAQEIDMAGEKCKVTVSIGLVWLDGPGRSWDEWLNLADAACYQAKQQGRNRVCEHAL
ncbi:GGDEF domain-containing protein [Aquitalea sp.]|uniref:GGDEF domain-containing protein n=1 Tax=Aquitalea sp. TaxID=1872623 RepID=UPI002590D26F|nr:GGDEF domain-containing protein [Aquitalea sp.]